MKKQMNLEDVETYLKYSINTSDTLPIRAYLNDQRIRLNNGTDTWETNEECLISLCKYLSGKGRYSYSENTHEHYMQMLNQLISQGKLVLREQNEFVFVSEKTPPEKVELLVKSPEGQLHLANWRPAYEIFACQNKSERSFNWQWKLP